jgi:molybdopterin-guanine dinucleotide biosynthesis protein A
VTGRARVLAGILVGGRGERMGGRAKGMMSAPGGGTLIDRWRSVLRAAGAEAPGIEVVLVGRREEYASVDLDVVDDDPPGIGPLGGLVGLLRRAERAGSEHALLLACDMPFVSSALVQRLIAAPPAAIVAPRRDQASPGASRETWEPLCARYAPAAVLPVALRRLAAGKHALQPLLTEAGAAALTLSPAEERELHDWDAPEDI